MVPLAAAVGAFVVCCAGPVLLAFLATTGLGVAFAHRGAFIAAAAGLIAALVFSGLMWQRRRACRRSVAPPTFGQGDSLETEDGTALSRGQPTKVP